MARSAAMVACEEEGGKEEGRKGGGEGRRVSNRLIEWKNGDCGKIEWLATSSGLIRGKSKGGREGGREGGHETHVLWSGRQ